MNIYVKKYCFNKGYIMNFIKKIITTFFILFTVCVCTACTPSKTVEKLPPTKPASLSGIGYDNFEEGLSAFAKDYDVIKTYLLDMMDYYDISKSLESEKLKNIILILYICFL